MKMTMLVITVIGCQVSKIAGGAVDVDIYIYIYIHGVYSLRLQVIC